MQRKRLKTVSVFFIKFFIQLRKAEHVFAEHRHLQLLPLNVDPI